MQPLNATELTQKITDVSEPVFTWFSDDGSERIELSGPVARRWIAKTDNFLASEFPYGGDRFAILLPNHWRTPFWLITTWLRGMELVSPSESADVDLVVSNDLGFLEATADQGGPDALVAQTQESLALAWPGDLPGTMLDGISDVMSHGDWVESPFTADAGSCGVSKSVEWIPPHLWSKPEEITLPIETLRGLDYLGKVEKDGEILNAGEVDLNGARVLVRTPNSVLFSAQLVQLWLAGARVIWAPGKNTNSELLSRERPDFLLSSSDE